MEMFEVASRAKLRFESPKGQLGVEDLWDLPLTSTVSGKANLDDVARTLHKQLKNDDNVSFVTVSNKSDPAVQLKFDIVKHIIDVRLEENKAAATERAKAEQKQKILGLIADREDDALKSLPLEELRKLLEG